MLKPILFFLALQLTILTVKAQYNPLPTKLYDSTAVNKSDTLLSSSSISVTTRNNISYQHPQKWGFITNVPGDLGAVAISPFQKKNLVGLSIVVGSTAILIWKDQAISNGVRQLASHMHLQPKEDYNVVFKLGGQNIEKLPRNVNSGLYQMGEGGTTMLLAGGLYAYGKINHDFRALQTASDLSETFLSMGIATQLLKRATGRQSPSEATRPGGDWDLLPSVAEYQHHVPNFDSFPSGHLATIMATVTVLAKNYPEKKWIRPIGYSLLGLVGFAMMNNKVHWASDYPLGIALGYVAGCNTVLRHSKPIISRANHKANLAISSRME